MKLTWQDAAPEWMALISRSSLKSDALAGLTGAAVVLPQAVAFAAIAGLPPEYGLYTAIIPPIVAAIFGSSLVMVSGPTTAISAVVFSALSEIETAGTPEFIQTAIILAFLVGAIQIAFALARIGRLAGFVSHSVMIGFTAAAAVLIGTSQLSPALGLSLGQGHGVLDRLQGLVGSVGDINPVASIVAIATLGSAILMRQYLRKWPGFMIAILVGTCLAYALREQSDTLAYVGTLPTDFPAFRIPVSDLSFDPNLIYSAFAISLIGLLEAIAIGRSMAHKTRSDFSANREVTGQGLSNLVGSFFQCYPSSGSFTRSGVNLEAGAISPLSSVFAAVFLLISVGLFGPYFAHIPVAAIAGLILYVAFLLIDFREVAHLLKTSRSETLIAFTTFGVGLFVNLEFAIYWGTFVSLAVFLNKSASPDLVVGAPDISVPRRKLRNAQTHGLSECPATVIVRLDGPLFFGSVDAINTQFRNLRRTRPNQSNMILILHGVGQVDLAGVELLEMEVEQRRALGGCLLVVVQYAPLVRQLDQLGLTSVLGTDSLFDSKGAAIAAAVKHTAAVACSSCTARVFLECENMPAPMLLQSEGNIDGQ